VVFNKGTNLAMNKTVEYLKEVKTEMNHVTWPTRKQAIFFTIAVLVVSVFIAYFLGLFDYLFSRGLELLLSK
jgi:preprotein translocase subunit SecE